MNLVLKLSKMELDSYFTEWQCKICEETAHVDIVLHIDEPFYTDFNANLGEMH